VNGVDVGNVPAETPAETAYAVGDGAGSGTGTGTGTDSGGTVIRFNPNTGAVIWTRDPSNGNGEGSAVFNSAILAGTNGPFVGYKNLPGTGTPDSYNFFKLFHDGTIQKSAIALSGSDILSIYATTLSSIINSNDIVVVGGVGDGSATVECFEINNLSPFDMTSAWTYDTGGTVYGVYSDFFAGFATNGHAVIVVGERVGSVTMWVLDATNGNLEETYDHGITLRELGVHNSDGIFVAGDRTDE
jgi:hypothetical protein